jgi:transcriptional regulator with XRE-family HTH domain
MKVVGINIKRCREEQSLTLRALAKVSGITASFLSQVESGKASPSLATLKAVADSLQTTVGDLIGENVPVSNGPVVRSGERKTAKKVGDKIKITMLTSSDPTKQMEPMLFSLDKDACSGERFFKHFGQEFVMVLKGALEITLNDTKYILRKGDCMYFNSHVPHAFRNVAEGETEALWVDTPPTF